MHGETVKFFNNSIYGMEDAMNMNGYLQSQTINTVIKALT